VPGADKYSTPRYTYQEASPTSGQEPVRPAVQESVLRAAAASVQQSGHEETARPAVSPSTPERPPTEADSQATASRPASGPVAVATAGSPAASHDVHQSGGPLVTDAAGPAPRTARARSLEAEPGSEELLEPVTDIADSDVPAPAPQLASLVAGMAPVDLAALQRGVDQFFTRLEGLGEELPRGPILLRLAPWIATTALATAAWEVAREQMRKQSPRRSGWMARPTPEES
jgi:hypothetical protein